jgi:RNA polymerase sigma factor (TIGR02999 family)
MSESHDATIPRLLQRLRAGDRRAFDELFPLVYDELRRVAGQQRRRWEGDDSLNTTALVHEAYLRLAGRSELAWQNQPHFMAVAAKAMRQILLDYAKRRQAAKRGGGLRRVPLAEIEAALGGGAADSGDDALIALNEALQRLEAHDARQSRIVECRFFGGMAIGDTAAALGISPATVKRGWAMAQAWLYRELARAPEVTT